MDVSRDLVSLILYSFLKKDTNAIHYLNPDARVGIFGSCLLLLAVDQGVRFPAPVFTPSDIDVRIIQNKKGLRFTRIREMASHWILLRQLRRELDDQLEIKKTFYSGELTIKQNWLISWKNNPAHSASDEFDFGFDLLSWKKISIFELCALCPNSNLITYSWADYARGMIGKIIVSNFLIQYKSYVRLDLHTFTVPNDPYDLRQLTSWQMRPLYCLYLLCYSTPALFDLNNVQLVKCMRLILLITFAEREMDIFTLPVNRIRISALTVARMDAFLKKDVLMGDESITLDAREILTKALEVFFTILPVEHYDTPEAKLSFSAEELQLLTLFQQFEANPNPVLKETVMEAMMRYDPIHIPDTQKAECLLWNLEHAPYHTIEMYGGIGGPLFSQPLVRP